MSASGHKQASAADHFAVVIASLGGVEAICALVEALPDGFPVPMAVALHGRISEAPDRLAGVVQRRTELRVRTACPGMSSRLEGITVVPTGWQATLDGDLEFCLEMVSGRALGDPLLQSAAERFGSRAIGIVLTGRLADGALGVRAIKRRGGRVLAQDPLTAFAQDMPCHAISTGCVDFVLSPEKIAAALVALTIAPGGAELLAVPTPSWASL